MSWTEELDNCETDYAVCRGCEYYWERKGRCSYRGRHTLTIVREVIPHPAREPEVNLSTRCTAYKREWTRGDGYVMERALAWFRRAAS